MRVTGLKELERALSKLPKELRDAAEKGALREGIKVIAKAVKSNAGNSKDSGLLQKSIGVTVRKVRSGANKGQHSARAGARSGFGKMITRRGKTKPENADPAMYAHMVEFGTSKAPAKPYIAPAIQSTQEAVTKAVMVGYNKALARAVAKSKSKI